PIGPNTQSAHRAGVNDATDTGGARRFEHVAGTLDVGSIHGRFVDHPQAIIGADMVNLITAVHCSFDRIAVAQISRCELAIDPVECASIGVWAHQSADMGAASGERPRDVTANEAVGAGYECNSVSHKSLCLMQKKRSALR